MLNSNTATAFLTIVYGMYKCEWLHEHISDERMLNAYREYLKEIYTDEFDADMSFDDYISERGFDGELYACFDEFIQNEFEDEDYIKNLLKDPALIKMYEEYISFSENAKEE